ncbi:MAG: hypothetical protein KDE59_23975, partial [Anaerolineales bacterium]|nr:hypothetical protein [Anaerolineales bacterium]
GSIVAYTVSRTVGMPGHGLESWWVPAGVLSLALEGAFTILMLFVWPQALKAAAVYSRAARALATAAQPAPSTRQRLITYFAPVSMILVLLLTGLVGAIWLSTVEVITQETLEQEYGIRVTMIATTMQDSAVDVRFEVLDQVKAQRLLENHDAHLYLRVGDNKDLIFSAGEGHHHGALREGINYYMFFPNPDHQIQPGTPVSFGFGNVQVEPIASR